MAGGSSSYVGERREQDAPATFSLASHKLGRTYADRNAKLCTIIQKLAEGLAEFSTDIDALGDAYEYLIGQFAAGSGKKAGEFYTPQQISDILSAIVTLDSQEPATGKKPRLEKVLDFACGSGSLLLNAIPVVRQSAQSGHERGGGSGPGKAGRQGFARRPSPRWAADADRVISITVVNNRFQRLYLCYDPHPFDIMEITNKTKKPLSVPLPAGKKLFLGMGKSGQITRKAAESPAVLKLVEAGEVSITEEGSKRQGGSGSGSGVSSASRHGGSGAMRQSGDK